MVGNATFLQMAIPQNSNELTAEWLTAAMQAHGALAASAEVASYEVEVLPAGVGFMGEVTRLHLTYRGEGLTPPPTMIAKIPTQDPNVRAMMKPARVFEREARFYAELAARTPLATPQCYAAAYDLDADDFLLLLEDLSGVPMGNQLAGCSAEQAEAALVGLAAHHGAFWAGAGLEGLDFVPDINSPLNKVGKEVYEASLPGFRSVFGHLTHPNLDAAIDGFAANVHQLLDRLFAMPSTLVHFDYRADNLFFGDDGVTAIDFQAISRGGGAADVGYFLSQNLTVAQRREHEDRLLHTYHDALVASGVSGYSFDQLLNDYAVGVMYGWIIPVFATGTLDATSERAIALWTEVIERSQCAIEDHDATRFLA
jgi:hypothetical protein